MSLASAFCRRSLLATASLRSAAPLACSQAALLQSRSFHSSPSHKNAAPATTLPDFLPPSKNTFNYTKVAPADLEPLKLGHDLYATVHIHDRKFLVTEGDEILLPVRLRDAEVGDVLEFDKISTIGSRDHTLTGAPLIDPSHFKIKGVVIEKTREKRRINERTQRRVRHVRHVIVKNCITSIRISEISLN